MVAALFHIRSFKMYFIHSLGMNLNAVHGFYVCGSCKY